METMPSYCFYDGKRLRDSHYDTNSDVLIDDALFTISHERFLNEGFHKLLKAMLKHAPTRNGQGSIAQSIVFFRFMEEELYYDLVEVDKIEAGSGKDKNFADRRYTSLGHELDGLKNHYLAAVIFPFVNTVRREVPPNHCWHPDRTKKQVERATRVSKIEEIIPRDNYRCCATGRMDIDVALLPDQKKREVLSKEVNVIGGYDDLEVAHIIPFSLNNFDEKVESQKLRAQCIWTALEDFAGMNLSPLKGQGINDMGNLFSLSPLAHKFYDRLLLSFYPSPEFGEGHRLQVRGDRACLINIRGNVKLSVNADWLAIHHAICQIVYEAGLTKEVAKIAALDREREEIVDESKEIGRKAKEDEKAKKGGMWKLPSGSNT
ncbi:hypothetical protein BDM02DRAFT_3273568 [Thelephora ganbajun]|uniref:Uncharacterized protein n=1 Tax=Thelephora ganbajun TaxID=370292 RepID=A0ACB6YYA0_THEGA|nr:hypothetical protein BDM02DRAFT_3273568 [Thelephora ganbajun]